MFYDGLSQFASLPAIINEKTDETISYATLDNMIEECADRLGNQRQLVFIEADNSITTVVSYLACLKYDHVVHLTESLTTNEAHRLIQAYQPNILIYAAGEIDPQSAKIERHHSNQLDLHDQLCLLMSTSGSTGSPKFVKLSKANLQSNAESIVTYLELTAADRALANLKLHYSYGLSILNSYLQVGGSLIFTEHSIIDTGFWAACRRHQATSLSGVPYTFEMLIRSDIKLEDYPSLRYITQAGGKLEADLVKSLSDTCAQNQIAFYVMYGQTEASPRIAYLPPKLASRYPGTIGKAIPGGTLKLINEFGEEIGEIDTPGELTYQGPNVMIGYAENITQLSTDQTPEQLLTGDIACRNAAGLFYITGRSSRFVKPFGIRINLDDVQSFVKNIIAQSAVTGNDSNIMIALESDLPEHSITQLNENDLINKLSHKYALPPQVFIIRRYTSLPRLSTGKLDYKQILDQATGLKENTGVTKDPRRRSWLTSAYEYLIDMMELRPKRWESILQVYQSVFPDSELKCSDSFSTLHSDSMSYVMLSLELEKCFGNKLPDNWQELSIDELNEIYIRDDSTD